MIISQYCLFPIINYFRLAPRVKIFSLTLILCCLLIPFHAFSQKELAERGEFKIRIEKSVSELEAERICLERARINAIENAFGQTIVQGNSTYIKNERTGTTTESKSVFNFMAETMVNGEWVEDIKAPEINKIYIEGDLWIEVKVYGKIREIKETPITFESAVLACPKLECKTVVFNNKQSVYLAFTAPEDGYISVYCDFPEEKKTYRMLPYKADQNISSYPIKADQTYLFFDPKSAKNIAPSKVDDLTFYLSNPLSPETSKIFVLFNPKNEIGKPILTTTNKETPSNLEEPWSLQSEDFQRWLQKIRRADPSIQLETTIISINP